MFGVGLHATAVGGKLAIHADDNKHPIFKLPKLVGGSAVFAASW